ncbi:hypothetical protein Plhal304r1_c024g0082941 [Plasmopara halstedii]
MNLNLTCGNRPSAPTILFISIIHHLSHTACGLVESKRPLCKVHSNQPQFTWKHFLSIPRLALRGLHLLGKNKMFVFLPCTNRPFKSLRLLKVPMVGILTVKGPSQ